MIFSLLTAWAVGTGASAPASSLLVTASWLKDHLNDPNLVVLHASMERAPYDAGHLPGARFASLAEFHTHTHSDQLLPPNELKAAIERLGVKNEDQVIIVGDPMGAAILFVAFDFVGHGDRTAILDGGLGGWKAAGGTLVTDPPTFAKSRFNVEVRDDLVVDASWIKSRLGSPTLALLDARSQEEYSGTTDAEGLPRYGHIPGAQHLEWITTLRDTEPKQPQQPHEPMLANATLESQASLERRFRAAGADPGDEVVTYCTVGMRASQLYFVARLLGRKAHLYVGSMADWSRRSDLPMVGPKPKGQ